VDEGVAPPPFDCPSMPPWVGVATAAVLQRDLRPRHLRNQLLPLPIMSTSVYIRRDGVAVLTLRNPPVNSLSQAHCKSLVQNMKILQSNPTVKGIVITGEG
ncbi:hypothetical protein FOZ62_017583, partial [Perkinsus olseni]